MSCPICGANCRCRQRGEGGICCSCHRHRARAKTLGVSVELFAAVHDPNQYSLDEARRALGMEWPPRSIVEKWKNSKTGLFVKD